MIEAQARIGAVIQIEDLTKRYGNQKAIDGLSLAVPEGSIFGLLGENGAGKTTTIQTLLGLITPDGGRTEVLGLDPARRGLDVRRPGHALGRPHAGLRGIRLPAIATAEGCAS